MSLADLSVKRPTFITCIIILMLAVGWISMKKLGVDLFPDVTFPVVTVTTIYPGAGPSEIETLVTKPLEDEISTLSGIKRLSSINSEGRSQIIAEFTMETDVKYAEQQIRDRVGGTKWKLPLEIKDPIIRRIDPADQPIVRIALHADLPESQLYDIASEIIRPKLEQINQVGLVEIVGGKKREIHVDLDRKKLKSRELSVGLVASRLGAAGENIPSGKVEQGEKQTVFRTMGEFRSLDDIRKTIISFFGSDVPTTIQDIGEVNDSTVDETSRAFVDGKPSLVLEVFRQTGANTIAVVESIMKRMDYLNRELERQPGHPKLAVIRDGSVWIKANVEDVEESILIGIALAVIVVYFFLGNGRSTIITGLALPNSLIGAFILMTVAGFSINIMSLLALSLSVGLLIDDAIVVRENIFRHIEMGKPPLKAALEGTAEVRMAVIATTFTVIAVFGPVGFLKGVVGQFFKQFGLTVCFAMAISLFDALTIAPMLSAYFAGKSHGHKPEAHPMANTPARSLPQRIFAFFLVLIRSIFSPILRLWSLTMGKALQKFEVFQTALENRYERSLQYTVKHPLQVLMGSLIIFILCSASVVFVPKTFLPPQDAGEFTVGLDLPPGTNLQAMTDVAIKVDQVIRSNTEVRTSALTVGGRDGRPEVAEFYVGLTPAKTRALNTSQFKEKLRQQLKPYAFANPQVKDFDAVAGGQRPFMLNIIGQDQVELERVATQAFEIIRKHPGLKDPDMSYRPGKPEFQVSIDLMRSKELGASSKSIGQELRAQVEGVTPAKFRELGREYDVRVRLKSEQRNLKEGFREAYIPNINNNLIALSDVARPIETTGPATINRQDRGRFISITGDITPGAGIGNIMKDVTKILEEDVKLPLGMRYTFVGQAENFQELGSSMAIAMGLGILFIFLVLASLYESFVTPFTIMLALPLAICGSLLALAISRQSLNIFSMIGLIMLLGVATKNSILLVDYAHQLIDEGMDRAQAIIRAGKTRLRPILMTTMALIAGTIPVALGLNEASRQRTSMGVSIIGGLISSTLLTLFVIPAAFSYIDRFRVWSKENLKTLFGTSST